MTAAGPDRRAGAGRRVAAAATVVLLLVAWTVAAGRVPPIVLPSPLDTLRALGELLASGELLRELAATLGRATAGAAVAVAGGVAAGVAAAHLPWLDGALTPVRVLLTGLPPVVTVVIAMIWLGPGGLIAVIAVVATMFPALVVAGREAARAVDPELVEMSRSFGVPTRWRVRHVVLPAAAPPVLAAVATGLSGALRLALMSELLAATDGIGAAVATSRAYLDTPTVFAWAAVAVCFAWAVDAAVLGPVRRRVLEPTSGRARSTALRHH